MFHLKLMILNITIDGQLAFYRLNCNPASLAVFKLCNTVSWCESCGSI